MNRTVRMFLQDDCVRRGNKGTCATTLAHFLTHHAAHEYTFTPVPIISTVLIKLEQVDKRLALKFSDLFGTLRAC